MFLLLRRGTLEKNCPKFLESIKGKDKIGEGETVDGGV